MSTNQDTECTTLKTVGATGFRARPAAHRALLGVLAGVGGILIQAGCGPTLGAAPTMCSTTAVSVGESPLMEPGGDCMNCHASYNGPGFTFAGTVMNALHDDQNCQGVAATVRIIDAANKVTELKTNSSGNFYSTVAKSSITFPFKAEIVRDGKTIAMAGPRSETETDCASCHTAAGANGALGRILAP